MKKTRSLALALLLAPLLLLAHSANAETLTACVRRSGKMYLIGAPFRYATCRGTETQITFNTEGPQGPQGPAGSLRLLDANDNDIGTVLGPVPGGVQIWHTSLARFMQYNLATGEAIVATPPDALYYTQVDCQGPSYLPFAASPLLFYRLPTATPPGIYELDAVIEDLQTQSSLYMGACSNHVSDFPAASSMTFVGTALVEYPPPLHISTVP